MINKFFFNFKNNVFIRKHENLHIGFNEPTDGSTYIMSLNTIENKNVLINGQPFNTYSPNQRMVAVQDYTSFDYILDNNEIIHSETNIFLIIGSTNIASHEVIFNTTIPTISINETEIQINTDLYNKLNVNKLGEFKYSYDEYDIYQVLVIPIKLHFINESVVCPNNNIQFLEYDKLQSKQLLRTNPKLTGNIKIIVDSVGDIYFDTFNVDETAALMKYKKQKIDPTSFYPYDIKRIFGDMPKTTLYKVKEHVNNKNTVDARDQYNMFYSCGCSSDTTNLYKEKLRFFAPLYLTKDLPDYFVVLAVDNYTEHLSENLELYLNNARIVTTFSLSENSAISTYINRYVNDPNYKNYALNTNFTEFEITKWYGIDYQSGILSNKGEYFYNYLKDVNADQFKMEEHVTEGFERNNLLYPNIFNLEFLFDDNLSVDTVTSYFGVYVNSNRFNDLRLDVQHMGVNVNNIYATSNINLETDYFYAFDNIFFENIKNKIVAIEAKNKFIKLNSVQQVNHENIDKTKLGFHKQKFLLSDIYGYSENIRQIKCRLPEQVNLPNIQIDFNKIDVQEIFSYELVLNGTEKCIFYSTDAIPQGDCYSYLYEADGIKYGAFSVLGAKDLFIEALVNVINLSENYIASSENNIIIIESKVNSNGNVAHFIKKDTYDTILFEDKFIGYGKLTHQILIHQEQLNLIDKNTHFKTKTSMSPILTVGDKFYSYYKDENYVCVTLLLDDALVEDDYIYIYQPINPKLNVFSIFPIHDFDFSLETKFNDEIYKQLVTLEQDYIVDLCLKQKHVLSKNLHYIIKFNEPDFTGRSIFKTSNILSDIKIDSVNQRIEIPNNSLNYIRFNLFTLERFIPLSSVYLDGGKYYFDFIDDELDLLEINYPDLNGEVLLTTLKINNEIQFIVLNSVNSLEYLEIVKENTVSSLDFGVDWYLPSRDELMLMRDNLHLTLPSLGGFTNNWFWSSSESSSTQAWRVYFGSVNQAANVKTNVNRVRAARTFISSDVLEIRDETTTGFIFHKVDNGNGTFTYYECAKTNQSNSVTWSNVTNQLVGQTSTIVDRGKLNTVRIINQVGHINSAAKLCVNLNGNTEFENEIPVFEQEDVVMEYNETLFYEKTDLVFSQLIEPNVTVITNQTIKGNQRIVNILSEKNNILKNNIIRNNTGSLILPSVNKWVYNQGLDVNSELYELNANSLYGQIYNAPNILTNTPSIFDKTFEWGIMVKTCDNINFNSQTQNEFLNLLYNNNRLNDYTYLKFDGYSYTTIFKGLKYSIVSEDNLNDYMFGVFITFGHLNNKFTEIHTVINHFYKFLIVRVTIDVNDYLLNSNSYTSLLYLINHKYSFNYYFDNNTLLKYDIINIPDSIVPINGYYANYDIPNNSGQILLSTFNVFEHFDSLSTFAYQFYNKPLGTNSFSTISYLEAPNIENLIEYDAKIEGGVPIPGIFNTGSFLPEVIIPSHNGNTYSVEFQDFYTNKSYLMNGGENYYNYIRREMINIFSTFPITVANFKSINNLFRYDGIYSPKTINVFNFIKDYFSINNVMYSTEFKNISFGGYKMYYYFNKMSNEPLNSFIDNHEHNILKSSLDLEYYKLYNDDIHFQYVRSNQLNKNFFNSVHYQLPKEIHLTLSNDFIKLTKTQNNNNDIIEVKTNFLLEFENYYWNKININVDKKIFIDDSIFPNYYIDSIDVYYEKNQNGIYDINNNINEISKFNPSFKLFNNLLQIYIINNINDFKYYKIIVNLKHK